MKVDANSKKSMHFISLIKQCQELALTARDAGNFIERRQITKWERVKEDLSEWSQQKWDDLYQLDDYYEKRVFNLKRLLKELIETSYQPLTLPMNWEYVVFLPPPFHKLL